MFLVPKYLNFFAAVTCHQLYFPLQFWASVALLLSLTGSLQARQRVNLKRNGRSSEGRSHQRVTLRRDGRALEVEGGIDFSRAERDPATGRMCVLEEQQVDTLVKKPVLECTHRYRQGQGHLRSEIPGLERYILPWRTLYTNHALIS